MAAVGSSPRARGQHPGPQDQRRHRRFIPACAGTTTGGRPGLPPSSVHPRVRGDNARHPPPRRTDRRFIPACAGTTRIASWGLPPYTRFIPACAGTTHLPRSSRDALIRFIPACAGTTANTCSPSWHLTIRLSRCLGWTYLPLRGAPRLALLPPPDPLALPQGLCVGYRNQLQPIEVLHPSILVALHAQGETLLGVRPVYKATPTTARLLYALDPQEVPHCGADPADEHPGVHLNEPPGQFPP